MRTPINPQGRGGAAAGNVSNRAQYLRPALDNQNSRMLAKAFGQINSSLGRIAANETRLQNKAMADELADAKEMQAQQEEIASQLGQVAGATGEDLTHLFLNNPASMQVYNEKLTVGLVDRDITGFSLEIQSSDLWGDPERRAEFLSAAADRATAAIEAAPPELRGEVAARWATATHTLGQKNDELALQTAISRETDALIATSTRTLLMAETPEELTGEILAERGFSVGTRGNVLGVQMHADAFVHAITMLPSQNSPADTALALERLQQAIDAEGNPLLGGFGLTDQGRIVDAVNSAQRSLELGLAREAKAQQALVQKELDGIRGEMLANPRNLNSFIPRLTEYGEAGEKLYKSVEGLLDFRDGAVFMENNVYNQIISKKNLSEFKLELDKKNLTAQEWVNYVELARGSLVEEDFESLLGYSPKFPDATKNPTFRAAMGNVGALQDLLAVVAGGPNNSKLAQLHGQTGGIDNKSAIGRMFEATLNDYIQDHPDLWEKALADGTEQEFILKGMELAMNTVLDHDFTGEGTSMRQDVTEWIKNPANAAEFANNPVAAQYFADTGLVEQVQKTLEAQKSLATAVWEAEGARMESMLSPEEAGEASDALTRAVSDDDGDGISNAREGLLSPEEELEVLENNLDADNPALIMQQNAQAVEEATGGGERRRTSFTRADLGIDNLNSPTQSDGNRVNASVRSFNLGAIGEMYSGDVEKKYEKAFGGPYNSITLRASSGSPIKTPQFDTPEEGVQYFGFWLKHRGEPRSIEAIINKYQTGSPEAYKKHVEKLTGIPRGDTLDDDQLAEVAAAMFDWEAGTGSHTADLANQITSNMDVKANILKGMKLYEDN